MALDGTKIPANASKHKAMSYGRMQAEEARLAAEVAALLQRAEETDAAEDAQFGPEVSGDEVPEALRRREDRLRKIREAKAALKAQAQIADAGYFSEAGVSAVQAREIEAFITPDQIKHTHALPAAPRGRIPQGLSVRDRMRRKLCTKVGRKIYSRRKVIVEPVLGQIKAARGFVRFLLRGLVKVKGEWGLITTAHNLCKLFQARQRVLAVVNR